jgi:rhodanese-related sulfurtransferase
MSNQVTDISFEELTQKIQNGDKLMIVDVRSASDFARGHIKGAINVPFPWKKTPKLPEDVDVVVVCYIGLANRQYSAMLAKTRSRVFRLEGGMSSWKGEVVSDKIGPQWSLDRISRLVFGLLLTLSFLLAFIFNPWSSIGFSGLVALDLVLGSIFNRSMIVNLIRSHGFK